MGLPKHSSKLQEQKSLSDFIMRELPGTRQLLDFLAPPTFLFPFSFPIKIKYSIYLSPLSSSPPVPTSTDAPLAPTPNPLDFMESYSPPTPPTALDTKCLRMPLTPKATWCFFARSTSHLLSTPLSSSGRACYAPGGLRTRSSRPFGQGRLRRLAAYRTTLQDDLNTWREFFAVYN